MKLRFPILEPGITRCPGRDRQNRHFSRPGLSRRFRLVGEPGPCRAPSWSIIAKIDRDEIERPVRRSALAVSSWSPLFLILARGPADPFLWQEAKPPVSRLRQLEAEGQRRALEQHFDYLTRYANDIILLSDEYGNIIEANERAMVSYGYGREELLK